MTTDETPAQDTAGTPDTEGKLDAEATGVGTATVDEGEALDAKVPEFAEVEERSVQRMVAGPERLNGVSVPVWAELGRVEMLIGELLQLGEGSVIRLDRAIGDPVDVISQGVKLARGEVIVVDDCFAIRIREILSGDA